MQGNRETKSWFEKDCGDDGDGFACEPYGHEFKSRHCLPRLKSWPTATAMYSAIKSIQLPMFGHTTGSLFALRVSTE